MTTKQLRPFMQARSLGEMAMVDNEPRSATAVVRESALLAVLTQESFVAITRDKPELGGEAAAQGRATDQPATAPCQRYPDRLSG